MMYIPAQTRYDSMRYNRCGRSGLKLPAISLGLWHNFGRCSGVLLIWASPTSTWQITTARLMARQRRPLEKFFTRTFFLIGMNW